MINTIYRIISIFIIIFLFACDNGGSSAPQRDVVLVLDESSSIGTENFTPYKNWVSAFINTLAPGEGKVHVALVAYDDDARLLHSFSYDKTALTTSVDNWVYGDGLSYTNYGIDYADELLDTSGRENVQRVAVVFADGTSTDNTALQTSADIFKAAGGLLYAVYFGSGSAPGDIQDIPNEDAMANPLLYNLDLPDEDNAVATELKEDIYYYHSYMSEFGRK